MIVYILQGKMGKTEKKHATKMTKIPKPKRRKYGMNKTKVSRNMQAILKNSVVIFLYANTIRKDIIFGCHLKQIFGPSFFVSALSALYCEERTESLKEYEQNSAT